MSSNAALSLADDKKFRRNYKACLNCRTRKVKCDLGSVSAPEPPCVRCKRERKECVFAESRRGGNGSSGTGSTQKAKKQKLEATPDAQTTYLTPLPVSQVHSYNPQQNHIHVGLNQTNNNSVPFTQPQPYISSTSSISEQAGDVGRSDSSSSMSSKESKKLIDQVQEEGNNSFIPPTRSSEFSTMQGALVFLARAAGTIAKADERDNINAREIHHQLETQESNSSTAINSPMATSRQNSTANPNNEENNTDQTKFENNFAPLIRPDGTNRASLPPVSNAASVRPQPTKKLTDIGYIGEGKMLTEAEAIRLINLFFLTLHPFFPHIPQQLHTPDVLAGYPILLCAILTIASRYHRFENDNQEVVNKNSRNIQLHERLWIYCQRLISQTVWAEASTRSIGTALAFLLFTEWNPRAIHWRWSDYANNSEIKDDQLDDFGGKPHEEEVDGFAGLSAMRRSDRMAWMLIGTSVRLSQDMGFITGSPEIFVATHISETNTAMNLGQRSMLSQSLGEVDLDNEEEEAISGVKKYQYDEFILSLDEETMRRRSMQKKSLKFTFSQKAKLEILKIMSLAYETIYLGGGNYNSDGASSRQNLTVLQVLSPLIDNWYRTYKKLLKPSNPKNFNHHCNLKQAGSTKHVNEITRQIDKESLICDYYYCQLYIYSLALSMENPLNTNVSDAKKPLNNIRLDEISKASKYVEIAYNSAKEILNAAIRIHKLKLLKYMPVRWVTRIVRSVAFIVKCFLTLTNRNKNQQDVTQGQTSAILTLSIIPIEDILQTIQKAAIVLREASPDELHLCTRYSTILMYLCTEMKHRTKFSTNAPEMRKLDENDDEDEDEEQEQQAQTETEQNPSKSQAYTNQRQSNHLQDTSRTNSNDYIPQRPLFAEPLPLVIPNNSEFSYPISASVNTPSQSQNDRNMLNYQQMGANNVNGNGLTVLPDAVIDWFLKNDESIGLDFVEPWTEMLEQQLKKN